LGIRAVGLTQTIRNNTGDQKRLAELVQDAERNLAIVKRQAVLSKLYVHDQNIVEAPTASVAHKPLAQMMKDE
jgi:hypothetical protein